MHSPSRGFGSSSPASAARSRQGVAAAQFVEFERAIQSGDLAAAAACGDALLARERDVLAYPDFIAALVGVRQHLGLADPGFDLLNQAIARHPGHEGLRERRARILGLQAKWNDVVASWYGWYPACSSSGPSLEQLLATYNRYALQAFEEHRYLDGALICGRYLAFRSDNADIWSNLGVFQTRLSHFQSSEESLKRSLDLNPARSNVWNSLGNLYSKTARHELAISAFKKSIELDEDNPNPWSNLANEYHINAQLDDAYRCSAKAISLQPASGPNFDHLTRMRRVCDFEAIEAHDWLAAATQMPVNVIPHSSLNLLTFAETPDQHRQLKSVYERWAEWIQRQASQRPLTVPFTARLGADGVPIRIGLLSADLRQHSVAKFLSPVINLLNREQFEVEAFSCFPAPGDPVQEELRRQIPHFLDVEQLSHRELASLIRERSIDVLMDLTGFTNHHRAGVVAYRPAPVQIAWLGYPGTMALRDLDYLLLDQYSAPASADFIREKPLIMAGSSVCFGSMPELTINPELPSVRHGCITFGSLNNSYKITAGVVELWAAVLRELPSSRLVFYRREFESAILRENLTNAFARHGVDPSRLQMLNNRSLGRHFLDCYNDFDLSLDTYPVVGGTTTCDALWMGVPVIALEGSNIHQRVCSAILRNLGCPELVAQTHQEFIQKSVELASDPQRLQLYRSSLRDRMRRSVLCDEQAFAANFSDAIRAAVAAVAG